MDASGSTTTTTNLLSSVVVQAKKKEKREKRKETLQIRRHAPVHVTSGLGSEARFKVELLVPHPSQATSLIYIQDK
jgi:hypothetical protein